MKKLLPSLFIAILGLSPAYGMERLPAATPACLAKKEKMPTTGQSQKNPLTFSLQAIPEESDTPTNDDTHGSRDSSPNTILPTIEEEEEDTSSNC